MVGTRSERGFSVEELAALRQGVRPVELSDEYVEVHRALAERHPLLVERHAPYLAVLLAALDKLPIVEGFAAVPLEPARTAADGRRLSGEESRPGDVEIEPRLLVAVRWAGEDSPEPFERLIYSRHARDLSGLRSLEAHRRVLFPPGSRFAEVHRYEVTGHPGSMRILQADLSEGGRVSRHVLRQLHGELVANAGVSDKRARELLEFLTRDDPSDDGQAGAVGVRTPEETGLARKALRWLLRWIGRALPVLVGAVGLTLGGPGAGTPVDASPAPTVIAHDAPVAAHHTPACARPPHPPGRRRSGRRG
jgi:hypothetical protein